jgi:hypothetical protein
LALQLAQFPPSSLLWHTSMSPWVSRLMPAVPSKKGFAGVRN